MRCRKSRYYSDLRLVGKPLKTAKGEFLEVPGTKNATNPEIKAFLAFVKDNKAESGFPQPSQFLDF